MLPIYYYIIFNDFIEQIVHCCLGFVMLIELIVFSLGIHIDLILIFIPY